MSLGLRREICTGSTCLETMDVSLANGGLRGECRTRRKEVLELNQNTSEINGRGEGTQVGGWVGQ
jgi:hypothetical protein